MKFDEFLLNIDGNLSDVKLLILKTLWDASDAFPRSWVKSSTLLSLTKQKYFDRRVRELRDELGCDIETEHHDGEHCYRLKSAILANCNPRMYLTQSQKNQLFSKANFTCQVCGRKTQPGVRGLQADHKVPLSRGGGHETSNWQAICNECNVSKRRACEGCSLECAACPWAFPTNVGSIILVRLPHEVRQMLVSRGIESQNEIESEVIRALKDRFNA